MIALLTLLTALLALLTYWQKYVREPEETRRYLARVYESAHKRNRELLEDLRQYSASNTQRQQHFMQGFSFDDAIQMLELCEREMFSNDHARLVREPRADKRSAEDLIERLQKHDQHVYESHNHFRRSFLGKMMPKLG